MKRGAFEFGSGNAEVGKKERGAFECGSGNAEFGKMGWALEWGSGTRRRPIGRDYDAARCGIWKKEKKIWI